MNANERDYESNPKLRKLALELEEFNRVLQYQKTAPAEIRAYLRGFADARLGIVSVTDVDLTTCDPQPRKEEKKLPVGVSRTKNQERFEARVSRHGRLVFFAVFDTPEEAHAAFRAKHIEIHGERSRYFNEVAA